MTDLGIPQKVEHALTNSDFDGIIALGVGNVHYLSGAYLPFLYHYEDRMMAVIWPRSGDPICFCPVEWADSVRNLGWIQNVQSYEGQDMHSAFQELQELLGAIFENGSVVGFDAARAPNRFSADLRESLAGLELLSCDELLKELRIIKTAREIGLLEDVAYSTDHAIVGAAHHILIDSSGMSKSEVGYRHDIIVHAMERYIDLIGHHSIAQVQSGGNSRKFWSMFSKPWLPERGTRWLRSMMEGDLIRAEMRASRDGYWSDAARMLTVGEAAEKQLQAYRNLVELKEIALAGMKPGNNASSVFDSVVMEARSRGIELIDELGVGHGIGVTTYEPPFLVKSDDTRLKPGMVITLDPVVYGPNREILRSKDTILINDEGCRILGRYIDWGRPHVPTHLSPRSTVEFARE